MPLTPYQLLKNNNFSSPISLGLHLSWSDSFLDVWPRQRKMEPRAEGTEHLAETGPHPTTTQDLDKLYPTSDTAQYQRPFVGDLRATSTLPFCLQKEPLALFSYSIGERLRNQPCIKCPGASRKAWGPNSQYLIICFKAHYMSRQVWEEMIWVISPQGSTMSPPALVKPC